MSLYETCLGLSQHEHCLLCIPVICCRSHSLQTVTVCVHDVQCGGEKGGLAAAEPYLKLMGKNIVNCGQSGNGQAAKVSTCIFVASLQSNVFKCTHRLARCASMAVLPCNAPVTYCAGTAACIELRSMHKTCDE